MKKMMSIALSLMMALALMSAAALADEMPQPEGGKKFEGQWAMMCGLVDIVYEEEGYRVSVDLYNQEEKTGTLWEYSCYYIGEKDALESISSGKNGYTLNPVTLDRDFSEYAYEGIDEMDQTTVFSLSEDGALRWQDGRENQGQDLEFRRIGAFEGVWRNEAEEIYTEFHWEGLYDEDTYFYSIFVGQGEEELHLVGLYNAENGKLECFDTAVTPVASTEDYLIARENGKAFDAVFSDLGNGKLLYDETADGIELEYDLLGPES